MDGGYETYNAWLCVDTPSPIRLPGLGLCLQKTHAGVCESVIGTGRIAFESPGNGRRNNTSLVETVQTAISQHQNH